MEISKENVAYLSNYEVLSLLEVIKKKPRNQSGVNKNQLATVTYETVRYLENTPCKEQTPEKVKAFLKAIQPFKLTKCEKLLLLNIRPSTALDIQLLIEDSEDRLTDKQVENLLSISREHLGGHRPVEHTQIMEES